MSPTGGIGGVALFTTTGEHTLGKGNPLVISGTAPTGFTDGTTYYVADDTNFSSSTFALAATQEGAPIAASDAGASVVVSWPTGTFRVIRMEHVVTEMILTGQANAAAARTVARDPQQMNQNQNWKRRRVIQNPSSGVTNHGDVFEYVVSALDDGG